MDEITRGIDHIGVTVPDIDEATRFFKEALGAKIVYDTLAPEEAVQEGPSVEKKLGLPEGAKVRRIRLLSIGASAGIELFEFEAADQHKPARASDYGFQHAAFYVDDINAACSKFERAGGTLLSSPNDLPGPHENGAGNRFVYGRTPWGMLIELISYPAGLHYPTGSASRRWTPGR